MRPKFTLTVYASFQLTLMLSGCDGTASLCGEYACVYYQSDCTHSDNCTQNQPRSCESAGSIRDRAPKIVNDLRSARRNCGQTQTSDPINFLTWDATLATASTSHARDMAAQNFESFTGSDGLSTVDRITEASGRTSINFPVAESIGAGPQTTAEIINDWLDIETDCRQMLDSAYTRIGLSCAASTQSDSGPYWSLVLAGPDSSVIATSNLLHYLHLDE